MDKHLIIYGKLSCGYCTKVMNKCSGIKDPKFTWEFIDITANNITYDGLSKIVGKQVNTVPQCMLDDKYIGDSVETMKYLETL